MLSKLAAPIVRLTRPQTSNSDHSARTVGDGSGPTSSDQREHALTQSTSSDAAHLSSVMLSGLDPLQSQATSERGPPLNHLDALSDAGAAAGDDEAYMTAEEDAASSEDVMLGSQQLDVTRLTTSSHDNEPYSPMDDGGRFSEGNERSIGHRSELSQPITSTSSLARPDGSYMFDYSLVIEDDRPILNHLDVLFDSDEEEPNSSSGSKSPSLDVAPPATPPNFLDQLHPGGASSSQLGSGLLNVYMTDKGDPLLNHLDAMFDTGSSEDIYMTASETGGIKSASNSVFQSTEQISVPHMPPELLDHIFSYLPSGSLPPLALTSHSFHAVSTRLLYRNISAVSLDRTVRCLTTLASSVPSSRELAQSVRSFEIGDIDANPRTCTLLRPFYTLLTRALNQMPALTALSFLLPGATAAFLPEAPPFQLTKLTCSCDFDSALTRFLATQPRLSTTLFCGPYTPHTALPSTALPALNRVSASPLILAALVPERPVREVELCLVHPWLLNASVLETTMQIVGYSRGPVRSLQIISHLTEAAETVLEALSCIPRSLGGLANLALHAVSGSVTEELLDGLPTILTRLTSLKSFMLLSKNKYDALHDAVLAPGLPASWAASCATLECVALPQATFVRHTRYGWVTLRDLERMLAEREQKLAKREKEVKDREEELEEEHRVLQEKERRLEEKVRVLRAELA